MNKKNNFYLIISSSYGEVGLIWTVQEGVIRVKQILLPRKDKAMQDAIGEAWPGFGARKGGEVPEVAGKIFTYMQGKKVSFSLDDLGLEILNSDFRQQVLLNNMKIPRGMVDTYGGLAAKMGHPGAARAVGTALANNPFPLVIPCHRVVRSDGHTGRFGGGEDMKKQFLQMEGVTFDDRERVASRNFYKV